MRSRYRFITVLSVCILLAAPFVFAQTTGNIQGTITDADGHPLPGVTVEVSGPSLQGARTVVTSADGSYRFPALIPGNYKVRAALSGFATVEKGAVVSLDATATANLVLRLTQKEEVVVSGEAPLVDTTSTTTGTSYTSSVMAKLPIGTNYAAIVRSNPGVSEDRGETQGRALALTIYGATSVENQYIIDGVNTTNVIKGFQGKAINGTFIQEVEVKTGGYQAEYGRAMGGVINVITKSGGNEFHGDAFVNYDSFGTQANQVICTSGEAPPDSTCKGSGEDSLTGMRISDYKRWDFGADFGGFILKDRIWFFLAYDRINYNDQKVARYVSSAAVPNTTEFPLDEVDNLYSGKLTFNIAQGSTLVATAFSDPTVIEGAGGSDPRQSRVRLISSLDPRTWESRRDIGGLDLGARFNQLFGSYGLVTLQAARHKDRYQLKPSGAGSGIRVDDFSCEGGTHDVPCVEPTSPTTTGGFGSIFGPTVNNFSARNMYRGDFTFYFGNHEAKLGADYQTGRTTAVTFFTGKGEGGYPGGQVVEIHNEYGDPYYSHDFFSPGQGDFTPIDNTVTPKTDDIGWYVQDSWKVTPSLTVNAGVRWDKEDIRDYTGTAVIKTTNEWQPRIGVIWDPRADGTTKLYAFYGRFYYALPTDLNVRAYGAQSSYTTYNHDPVITTPDPTVFGHESPFFQGGAFTEPVDTNIKGIYQDEYTIGVEHLLDPTFSVGLKGTYRNLGSVIEDRCDLDYLAPENNFNSCGIMNPGSGELYESGNFPGCSGLDGSRPSDADGNPLPCNFGTVPAIGNASRIYRGIEVTGRKQFSQSLWAQA
ncbi:MAG TPA: TonB-dependent receptor, partial [Thermoanaerobaculia bacterium]